MTEQISKPPRIKAAKPRTLGWLKRSELGPRTWELPNGALYQFAPDAPEIVQIIDRRPEPTGGPWE